MGKIFENNGRVSVLAGRKKIDDMLIFIAYKKLQRTLANPLIRHVESIKTIKKG